MAALPFFTTDVFTETRFGGNPLAVIMADPTLDSETMQAIAAEFNLSETTFVLPPVDPENTAAVRIFNRKAEMDFAGHPIVGTAFVMASQSPDLNVATFEIVAGIVAVTIDRDANGAPIAATITTPQPLDIGEPIAADVIESVLGLDTGDVVTTTHPPLVASNGNPYIIAELTREALGRCTPDLRAFAAALAARPQLGIRFSVHVYHRQGRTLRARMFAPLAGTWEDPATGSANAPLACLLLSLEPAADEATFVVHQGVEMGRPSLLHVTARRSAQGIFASLRGSCVPVTKGILTI